ncbi:MAG TPA: hypothetical protein VLX92_07585 [Kofleriaceae bacterium]|nr:hypothetical protein [Kofleriaceae bacterium]
MMALVLVLVPIAAVAGYLVAAVRFEASMHRPPIHFESNDDRA